MITDYTKMKMYQLAIQHICYTVTLYCRRVHTYKSIKAVSVEKRITVYLQSK